MCVTATVVIPCLHILTIPLTPHSHHPSPSPPLTFTTLHPNPHHPSSCPLYSLTIPLHSSLPLTLSAPHHPLPSPLTLTPSSSPHPLYPSPGPGGSGHCVLHPALPDCHQCSAVCSFGQHGREGCGGGSQHLCLHHWGLCPARGHPHHELCECVTSGRYHRGSLPHWDNWRIDLDEHIHTYIHSRVN